MKGMTQRCEKNTQIYKLYKFIILNYPNGSFTTTFIYQNAEGIGLNPKSVGSSLNNLKKKGILSNSGGTSTSNGRVQKQWKLV
ncbi:hypothetical protein BN424_90 [Carnobacterium maltaromaticum LMA28]|uniref:Uncharacterized protein n=1 Tax=Carnobacterium maltaromaticum LMA28 TaxID=1234679 RepID=K8ECW5_CARML|nr:hypothetical protein BN424_90 [Carnobacterium maltaromaticum LMA28]